MVNHLEGEKKSKNTSISTATAPIKVQQTVWIWGSAYFHFPERFAAGGRSGGLTACGPEKNVLLLPVVITGEKLFLLCVEQPDYVALHVTNKEVNKSQGLGSFLGYPCVVSSRIKATYPFQYGFLVVAPFHEQHNLPTCVAVDRIDLHFNKPEEDLYTMIVCLECAAIGKLRRSLVSCRPELGVYLIASGVVNQLVAASMERLSCIHGVKDHFVSYYNLHEGIKGCFRTATQLTYTRK